MMLENTQLTNQAVQTLVAKEWESLRLLRSLSRGIQEKVNINILKNIWRMLIPVVQDFQDSYRVVAVLCTDNEEASQLDQDLQTLNLLEIFNDTSSLMGAPTALDKIINDIQAAIAEVYDEVWAASNEGHQGGALQKISSSKHTDQNETTEDKEDDEETEDSEGSNEDEENKKTEQMFLKKIILPSLTPSAATSKPENGDPMASSKKKRTDQDKEQEKVILHRFKELEKRQKEIQKKEREQ